MVKRKLNLFDGFVILAVALLIGIGLVAMSNKPYLGDKNVLVEVRFSDTAAISASLAAVKDEKTVFYSGTKYSVNQVSYRTELDAEGQIKYLYVTVEGLGKIKDNDSIFEGQRIFDNQKVELRGDYQLQGVVTDYRYEN